MSKLNGDRARFQRLRKAGLVRRERSRAVQAAAKLRAAAGRLDGNGEAAEPIAVKLPVVSQ